MAVLGYGLGGYGGFEEPWGSVEFPTPSSLNRDASSTDFLGLIEASSGIIGEEDNLIGGFRSTRLTAVANELDTSISVESTLGWDSSGKISIDGVVYYYTSLTATTISGLSYMNGGSLVLGIAKLHHIESEVIDLKRNYSYLDKLRRSILVDYAEGEDLRIIGRDLGVPYIALFGDDDTYRGVIKAIAYSPVGTNYGIELALDSILGVGNYEIYEDLVMRPCEVVIKVSDSYLTTDTPYGKSYFDGKLYGVLSGSSDTVSGLPYSPTSVITAKLKGISELFDFRDEIPSATQYLYYEGGSLGGAFTYAGSLAEGSAVTNLSGQYTIFDLTTGSNDAYYEMDSTQGARIDTDSIVTLDTVISIPTGSALSSGALEQISFSIGDGSQRISVGVDSDYSIGLFDTEGGGFIGDTSTLSVDEFYSVKLVKHKDSYVELYIDGILISREDYSSFSTSYSDHHILFGLQGTPLLNASFYIKQLCIGISGQSDKWATSLTSVGSTNIATPSVFTVSSGHTFSAGDIGDFFEIQRASATNSYGGNVNGKYKIGSIVSSTAISLVPISFKGVSVESGVPSMVILPESSAYLKYPDDLGKYIKLSESDLGNNGTYQIIKLLQDDTLEDLSSFDTYNTCYTRTCLINSGGIVSEVNLTASILPYFITDTGLGFIHSNSGSISGSTITLRNGLWANDLLMELDVTNTLTSQLLYNAEVSNSVIGTAPLSYEYYPVYLSDKLGALKTFMDILTIAGVIPRIENR